MLGDAYQDQTNAVLLDMAQRPQPRKPAEPSFSIWGLMKAAPKGTAAGAAQGVASTADVTGAFGDVLGSLGDAGAQGMFGGMTEKERQETEATREKLIKSGPNYTSEAGSLFRGVAKDYMPDPATAHASEQVVANLFRVGSKVLTSAAAIGNVPGAIVAGSEEGFTQSDELREQGVDLTTRTKVGAVTAVTNAVGFALPVAGATWKSTIGLAAAGGPGSFIAQTAATREILKAADYSKLADQYDPFDPVSLALSTLLPLGFGALAMRGKAKAARVDEAAVDAARTNMLSEQINATRPTPPQDLAGAAAHSEAFGRAVDQLADGARVDVSNVARGGEHITAEVADALKPVARALDELPKVDVEPAPDVWFTGAPQEGLTLTRTLDEQALRPNAEGQFAGPGHYTSTSRDLAGTYGGETGRLYQVEQPFKNAFDFNKVENRQSGKTRYEALVKEKGSKAAANAELRAQGYDAITFTSPRGERIANVFEARPLKDSGPARAPKKAVAELSLAPKEGPDLAPIADDLGALYPDLSVQLDGMDVPMKVSELLARIREESKLEIEDSKLLETAAQCFITTG